MPRRSGDEESSGVFLCINLMFLWPSVFLPSQHWAADFKYKMQVSALLSKNIEKSWSISQVLDFLLHSGDCWIFTLGFYTLYGQVLMFFSGVETCRNLQTVYAKPVSTGLSADDYCTYWHFSTYFSIILTLKILLKLICVFVLFLFHT